MKLHLGCGGVRLEGYTNIDLRGGPSCDIVCDIVKLDFPDNSVDEIFMNAVFEHLWKGEQEVALRLWHRILKPKGLLKIKSLPDFERVARAFLNKEKGIVGPVFDLYNVSRYTHGAYGEGDLLQIHKDIFTKDSISSLLRNTGFDILKIENAYWENEPIDVNLSIEAMKR